MGFLKRYLARRLDLLESRDPIRALAANPDRAYHQLSGAEDNAIARARFASGLRLCRLHDGSTCPIASLCPGAFLFVLSWEPFSAEAVGALFRRTQREPTLQVSVVFLDDAPIEALRDRKRQSWYFERAFLPSAADSLLQTSVHRVPWLVELDRSGAITSDRTGRLGAA
jgi:hypothetical protein